MNSDINQIRHAGIVLAMSLILAAIAGLIVHKHQKDALMSEAFSRLALYHDLRKSTLQDYMRSKASDVIAMSRNDRVLKSFQELENAWLEFGPYASDAIRARYIIENPYDFGERRNMRSAGDDSKYTKVHPDIHDWARRFLEHFGYHDVFLINVKGNILYTVEKEEDFATNLANGPYADSPLGFVFNRAVKSNSKSAIFSDFERYAPSNNAPALFAGSQIKSTDGRVIGVFAVQLPAKPINDILRYTGGMGETGETYIVGNDMTMRSQSRFSNESTLLETKVDTLSVRRGLNGFDGAHIIPDYRGVPVLSVFSPIDFGGEPWVLLAEIDEAEVLASLQIWPALIAALIAAILGAFFCHLALLFLQYARAKLRVLSH
jgi:methyl-accepting chemotaxis protein